MPLVNPTLVRLLVEQKAKWDVVVPRMGEFLEPLHAVYSKRCLPTMEQFLLSGGRRILDLYPKLKVLEVSEAELRKVDPELLSFFNVNTPEDLSEVEALWSRT
jgi:molybdopterin-guanine dinucleotide biosynthesis protein A